uniref:Retrovirus-related Pol polyprotein from transposon TNT 1-94 n=1 Tax=Tanacetum cinerariifolium TaxID=118510 RepID=A0A6L2LZW9_TANCI|nr:retrovirus-related Pol polyprotein from transposon TNT 1-94 [Tanacetum cinerariifolium]
MAQATQSTSSPSQYVPPPPQYAPALQQAPQSTNDAMLATMNQIVNLLSGFQKQFPPTNNQLKTSTNPMTQATIQAGQITTESVQRRAPEECKEKKRAKESQWFKDKALLMEAKEKGVILDAEAEAFLADVVCTSPYAEPLAITTSMAFEVSHEDVYDSDVDEVPHAAVAFMANLMQTGPSTGQGTSNDTEFHSEVQTYDNHFFDNMNLQDLHKYAIGHHNPLYLTSAQLCRPTMYLGDVIVDPVHTPFRVYDSEETLVQAELDKEYDQCVIDKKSLEIENKNLLIQNECLLAKSVSKDICSVVLTSDIVMPISVEPRSNCVKERFKNLELEAEILKVQQLLVKKKNDVLLLKRNIKNSSLNFKSTKNVLKNPQLKEELTAVSIKNDSLRDENVSIKKRYQDLYQSKAESNSNVSSGAAVPEKPKVLAPGLFSMMPKYVSPQKINNGEANTHLPRKETVSLVKKTNVCVNLSTRIKSVTEASKSKSKCETKTHRNLPARSENVKRVDNPLRNLNKRNRVDSSLSVNHTGFILKTVSVCKTCNECLVFGSHDKCGVKNLNSVNAKNLKVKNDANVKQVWKATGKIFASVGSKWKPTGRKFTLGDTCTLTRITKPEVVPLEKLGSVSTSELDRKLKDISTGNPPNAKTKAVNDPVNVNDLSANQLDLKNLGIRCYKHKDRKLKDISTGNPPNAKTKAVNDPVNVNDLSANQMDPKKLGIRCSKFYSILSFQMQFIQIVFWNDQFAAIVGYGNYKIGDTIITQVYYVEASSTKSWLWHRRLNHLNFGTLNELARKDLVRGLPKLKYKKEHLCPLCQLGKSKKSSHSLKTVNTNIEVLNTLYMDLRRPIRVESINRKKYIMLIVDDCTRFGWVRFLRTKDETPEVIKKFIILTQHALNATIRYLRTDNGTEFVNKTLTEFCESVGITHNTSIARTPQQNIVVKRQNRTLMEAARTMLIFAKALMFLWAEAVATACYTLNRFLIHTLHGKTYYELLTGKKPEVKYFWVFLSLCYPTNDYDDLGKMKAKADIDNGVDGPEYTITTSGSKSFKNSVTNEFDSEASSFGTINVNPTQQNNPPIVHGKKWTKDHPLGNAIGDLNRPVSTRRQLKPDAMWCFFNEFLENVEPKNFKEAIQYPCWIDAMQEEIYEFERLAVWELVPTPSHSLVIRLK